MFELIILHNFLLRNCGDNNIVDGRGRVDSCWPTMPQVAALVD